MKRVYFSGYYRNVRRKIYWLTSTMSLIGYLIALIVMYHLYTMQVKQSENSLTFLVNTTYSYFKSSFKEISPDKKVMKTIMQEMVAHNEKSRQDLPGLGDTGELIMAAKNGNQITYITSLRFNPTQENLKAFYKPMSLALKGEEGTYTGIDYKGKKVLAVYHPLLDKNFGIVAQIDLWELQKPVVFAAIYTGGLIALIFFISTWFTLENAQEVLNLIEIREMKYQAYVTYAPVGIGVFNSEGLFLEVNEKLCDIIGLPKEKLVGGNFIDILLGHEIMKNGVSFIKAMSLVFSQDSLFINKKQEYFYITVDFVRISTERILCFFSDITAKREVELNLNEREEMFKKLFLAAKDAIIVSNEEGKILLWNKQAEKIFGYKNETAHGQYIESLIIPPQEKEKHRMGYLKYVQDGASGKLMGKTFETIALTRDQRSIQIEMSLSEFSLHKKRHAMAVIRDLTEKKQMERQLMQTSKMATLGEMAAGVAHELNQPLTVIRMGVQLVRKSNKNNKLEPEMIENQMEMLERNVERMIRIISNLRTFGRKYSDDGSLYNINTPVERSVDLVKMQIKNHSIVLETSLADDLPEIKGDENSIEHVIINFIMNSIDAFDEIEDKEDKKILLMTSYNKKTDTVIINYKNNGPPIPEDIIDHIFEPFSTSKPPGKGTGLGMSIAYGVVQSHNGTITAKNTEYGPMFTIEIPVYHQGKKSISGPGKF